MPINRSNLPNDEVSRIDERVKMLIDRQDEVDEQLKKLTDSQHVLSEKITILSLKIGSHDDRWSKIFDGFWKIALTIIAGYILYKLGLH